MPTKIIELQRRLTPVGAIRAGGEKPAGGVGRKLESVRLTSPRRELIEQAAQLYGGEVTPWQSPRGDEWQVYTSAPEIPVYVMPDYSLTQMYERWEGATKRTRLCDGEDEELSNGPCICASEGVDRCDIYSRLHVALPELNTVLGWKLITRGANAAHELPTFMALVESIARGQTFVRARLRLDNRRGVKDGQVVRYVVPVLDLDVSYLQLGSQGQRGLAEAPALPAPADTYEPAPPRTNHSVAAALDSVTGPLRTSQPSARDAAPLPPAEAGHGPAPEAPVEDDGLAAAGPEQTAVLERESPMWRKLNVLVGTLRDGGHIETAQLYDAIGLLRGVSGEEIVLTIGGYDAEQNLHWAPLRDSLTRPEASQLIDWLTVKEQRVKEATG